jgi:hypothetical protein
MKNNDNDLLFASRIIPKLLSIRGVVWQNLVDRVSEQDPTSVEHLAFVLMMVRLDGCTSCNADSFRAMRGCTQCAIQTVNRFRGSDEELVEIFNGICEELEESFK